MRKIAYSLLLVLAATLIAASARAETRRVDGLQFDSVLVYGDVEVEVSQGEPTALYVRGESETLDMKPFLMEDNSLVLGYSREHRGESFSGVKFRLVTPRLSHLELKGRGDVYIKPLDTGDLFISSAGSGRIRLYEVRGRDITLQLSGSGAIQAAGLAGNVIAIALSGSGDIQLGEITAGDLEVSVRGSGDVNLAEGGATEGLEVNIVGSGDVLLTELSAGRAEINIIGSGDAAIGEVNDLEANILGSGDVLYRGTPTIDQTILGSGELRGER